MKEQTYANHARLLIGFHGITFLGMLALIIGAIMNFINTAEENLYSASLIVLISFILVVLAYYLRAFALKAQDRAISAEEKLRYFILTGKPLSNKLTIRQVIGLRFASDDEFINLVDRAEKESLSEKEIKKAIINWKADTYRV
ncbi:DUF6526 family protein [Lutibacter flavus]|uniref:Uncharacterized protein n=1 Tax=Lutibacter flavus TaxID=691689 RepID=A0A238V6C9_9FLAO|nr:DUF6526 family protein [Lutibacter flavus]SNR29836.1 hypothetical protein SAMN04488111_0006 [Lutibacter flavus]